MKKTTVRVKENSGSVIEALRHVMWENDGIPQRSQYDEHRERRDKELPSSQAIYYTLGGWLKCLQGFDIIEEFAEMKADNLEGMHGYYDRNSFFKKINAEVQLHFREPFYKAFTEAARRIGYNVKVKEVNGRGESSIYIDPPESYQERFLEASSDWIHDYKVYEDLIAEAIRTGRSPDVVGATLEYLHTDKTQDEAGDLYGCCALSIRNYMEHIVDNAEKYNEMLLIRIEKKTDIRWEAVNRALTRTREE